MLPESLTFFSVPVRSAAWIDVAKALAPIIARRTFEVLSSMASPLWVLKKISSWTSYRERKGAFDFLLEVEQECQVAPMAVVTYSLVDWASRWGSQWLSS